MAARRKGKSRGAPAESAEGKPNGKIDFFPPGFEGPELPPVKDSELVTYFVFTNKKGLEFYAPHAARYHHTGFRAVIVGPPTFTFDQRITRLVGRVRGDHFHRAAAWAKTNIVNEVHAKFKLAGGGTIAQREAAMARYTRAKLKLAEHDAKRKALEDAVDAASLGLLERFGKGPLEIEGATHDPSFARDTVYWKKRMGK